MAKKTAGGPNKSAAIREYLDSNPDAKPREIVDALKAQGVEVTPAFVSTIKSKSTGGGSTKGAPRKRRGRPKAAASSSQGAAKTSRRTSAGGAPKRGGGAGSSDTVSVDGLVRAKQLANELGGVDKLRAALSALEKITG